MIVILTQVVLTLLLVLGGAVLIARQYPPMQTYVDQTAGVLLSRVDPWAKDIDRRVKALEDAAKAVGTNPAKKGTP